LSFRSEAEESAFARCAAVYTITEMPVVELPCTPPNLAAERQSSKLQAQQNRARHIGANLAPCPNAERPYRLEVAHCLYKHCLWLWVRSGQSLLPTAPGQSAPGESTICPILLHRHNMPHPIKDSAYR
jgi:hypothetical protein